MRSGIVYGTAGMLDGIIDRIREMLPGEQPTIVATGSNAPVIVRYCRNKVYYDKYPSDERPVGHLSEESLNRAKVSAHRCGDFCGSMGSAQR